MTFKKECDILIEDLFDKLQDTNVVVGEIYSCLGLDNKGDNGIDEAAKELLKLIKEV